MSFDLKSFINEGVTGSDSNVARSTSSRGLASQVQEPDSGAIAYGMQVNENYLVRVVQNSRIVAKGYVPETFQLSIVSRYGQPFGQGIANSSVGNAAKVLGHTALTSQSMTMQVWEGSEPLEMQFEFEFLAENDPYLQVLKPVKDLLRLVMPSSDGTKGGLLTPPGPQIQWTNAAGDVAAGAVRGAIQGGADTIADIRNGNYNIADMVGAGVAKQSYREVNGALKTAVDGALNKISINIGRFMYFDNVVIESVNQTWHSMFTDEGLPLRCTVQITFKTFMIPTVEDLDKIFNHHGGVDDSADRAAVGVM